MRLLGFTLLAITAATGIQWALGAVPPTVAAAWHGTILLSMLVLPVIATAGLAYAMRIGNLYVFFLAILSPFIAAILSILFLVGVLNEPFYV